MNSFTRHFSVILFKILEEMRKLMREANSHDSEEYAQIGQIQDWILASVNASNPHMTWHPVRHQ